MVTQFSGAGLPEMATTRLWISGQLMKPLKLLFFNRFKSKANTWKLEDLKTQLGQFPHRLSFVAATRTLSLKTQTRKRQPAPALCSKLYGKATLSRVLRKPSRLWIAKSKLSIFQLTTTKRKSTASALFSPKSRVSTLSKTKTASSPAQSTLSSTMSWKLKKPKPASWVWKSKTTFWTLRNYRCKMLSLRMRQTVKCSSNWLKISRRLVCVWRMWWWCLRLNPGSTTRSWSSMSKTKWLDMAKSWESLYRGHLCIVILTPCPDMDVSMSGLEIWRKLKELNNHLLSGDSTVASLRCNTTQKTDSQELSGAEQLIKL